MIEVFTTDIPNQRQGNQLKKSLKTYFPDLKFDFDTEVPIVNYPCDHSILRVEGNIIDSQCIVSSINKYGYNCHVLEDKVCK